MDRRTVAVTINKLLVSIGVSGLLQSLGQIIYTSLSISQYYCLIDLLQEWPLLVYIKIIYFHNTSACGPRINIGQSIDGMANQAFVLLQRQTVTAYRVFIINSLNLGFSFIWIIASFILIRGGMRDRYSNHTHWPWVAITSCICLADASAVVTFVNDSFHTRTLQDTLQYIGGTSSGTGNVDLDTSMATWSMAILYSRFVIMLPMNVIFIIFTVLDCTTFRVVSTTTSDEVESSPNSGSGLDTSDKCSEEATGSLVTATRIPRPGLSQSFRNMKDMLFKTTTPRCESTPASLDGSPERNRNRRTVNFLKGKEPSSLENMIAEQQRKLNRAVIDTSGRRSPPAAARSLPQLNSNPLEAVAGRGRRGTAAELGQMPWAYIPASAHRMRDQLPPDEDLPPVPLPDYTAFQSHRKASVHRAASSLSSVTQKKEYTSYQSQRPALTRNDVLY